MEGREKHATSPSQGERKKLFGDRVPRSTRVRIRLRGTRKLRPTDNTCSPGIIVKTRLRISRCAATDRGYRKCMREFLREARKTVSERERRRPPRFSPSIFRKHRADGSRKQPRYCPKRIIAEMERKKRKHGTL